LAARTQTAAIAIQALLLPLHDPIRVAEDLIVADLVSGGRIGVTCGLGYRPSEYAAHRKDWSRRGAIMDECLATLLQAWRGEPIDRDGQQVKVTPRPLSPHPPVMVGGNSKASAQRAVRFGLPLSLPARLPELEAYYRDLCEEAGVAPVVVSPAEDLSMIFVAEDPDRAWHELGAHLLHEAATYASWQTPSNRSSVHSRASDVAQLRAEGIYEILSPAQCRERAVERGNEALFALHPLCGGMPLEAGWDCLNLFIDGVMKKG